MPVIYTHPLTYVEFQRLTFVNGPPHPSLLPRIVVDCSFARANPPKTLSRSAATPWRSIAGQHQLQAQREQDQLGA